MNTQYSLILALLALPALSACQQGQTPNGATQGDKPQTLAGQVTATALQGVRENLRNGSLRIGGGQGIRFGDIQVDGYQGDGSENGLPLLEITPTGELVLQGQRLPLSTEQQSAVQNYRQQALALADGGIAIGIRGADMGGAALSSAIGSAISMAGGDSSVLERELRAHAATLQNEVRTLCDQLGTLHQAQEQLSASLPAFAPYAVITPGAVQQCHAQAMRDLQETNAHTP